MFSDRAQIVVPGGAGGNGVASFRREVGPSPTEWELAMEAERASQMWSLRRRAGS